jgi:iron complex transport system permease protein
VKPWTPARLVKTLLASAGVWAVLAGACLMVGSTGGFGWPNRAALGFRLDVVLLASLVGAGLSSAGVVFQAILRNPLAEPYLLGVSSGATLSAYLWHLPFMTGWLTLGALGSIGEPLFAFGGAVATILIVFFLASRRGRLEPVTLLLVGVIVNAITGSIFLLINSMPWIRDPATPGGSLRFLVGGLQTNLTWHQIWPAAVLIGVAWVALLWFSGQLNAALLSEAEAESLGVRIHRLRWIGLVLASLMTASAVAVSGPIGFIGLVCPHVGRLLVGNDQRRLLPLATALGAGLLAVADAISRALSRPGAAETILPVGVLTGLLGGPFFLMLLWRSRHRALEGG